jgi:leader peptidase (prepilin peptidase)/N-methyltransferase
MLGWKLNLLATFLAIVGGGFYGMFLLASKKADRKSHFAFGPFLCIGLAVSLFVGERLLTWYLGFFV